eukprot:6363746-Alexandrium_andersonii.AAC.1
MNHPRRKSKQTQRNMHIRPTWHGVARTTPDCSPRAQANMDSFRQECVSGATETQACQSHSVMGSHPCNGFCDGYLTANY